MSTINKNTLKKIIMEEIAAHETRQMLREGSEFNPVKVTPELLNRIIKEEYEAHNKRQRLAEARRLRARARQLENL